MSHTLEIPDELYDALKKAAESSDMTPLAWIAAHLPNTPDIKPKTLADLFAGRIGRIRSGSQKSLSEDCGPTFTEYLNEKQRGGHL
ncbi:hypothetical protein H8E77_02615 [bacterium]|nr:hypothetical protein [bacterium]